ncbi:uncharacterized protein LOC120358864 [Solenopsis invicta]|uniref:uncharacterized protein LOC120358864 n=1 Tax=Solenopsis invicta TaxID=13686 RepID=UPI00193D7159|nr:uncharacterized protein LOC120358864 [Solenopsis invicta]
MNADEHGSIAAHHPNPPPRCRREPIGSTGKIFPSRRKNYRIRPVAAVGTAFAATVMLHLVLSVQYAGNHDGCAWHKSDPVSTSESFQAFKKHKSRYEEERA